MAPRQGRKMARKQGRKMALENICAFQPLNAGISSSTLMAVLYFEEPSSCSLRKAAGGKGWSSAEGSMSVEGALNCFAPQFYGWTNTWFFLGRFGGCAFHHHHALAASSSVVRVRSTTSNDVAIMAISQVQLARVGMSQARVFPCLAV